ARYRPPFWGANRFDTRKPLFSLTYAFLLAIAMRSLTAYAASPIVRALHGPYVFCATGRERMRPRPRFAARYGPRASHFQALVPPQNGPCHELENADGRHDRSGSLPLAAEEGDRPAGACRRHGHRRPGPGRHRPRRRRGLLQYRPDRISGDPH